MPRPPQPTQWLETIDAFIAGRLDAAASREFQETLRSDEQARLVYVEYLDLHFELLQHAGQLADAESVAHKARQPRYGKLIAAGAAAAVIGLVSLTLWQRVDREQVARDAAPAVVHAAPVPAAPVSSTPPPVVARLTRVVGAKWTDSERTPGEGDSLRVGDVLDFTAGSVEVEFESGARACLVANEGVTALLRLKSPNACQFESGCATFKVPDDAHGFSVETFGGRFVDHGTEFGVTVDPRGPSQVHVMDGQVEAISRQSSRPLMLSKGGAAALDGAGRAAIPIAFRPETFVRPATLSWGIESFSDSLKPYVSPPPSLRMEAELSEGVAHLILEQRAITDPEGWENRSRNVFETVNSRQVPVESFSVAPAARFDSYLFHAAPTSGKQRRDVKGEIRFRRPILAVITDTGDLTRSRKFGLPQIDYTDDKGHGLEASIGQEANEKTDVIVLGADRQSLKFTLNMGRAIDEFRVLVAADDAPAGMPDDAEEKR